MTTCWTKRKRNITWNFWLNHVQHLNKIEENSGRYFQNDLTLQRLGHQCIRSLAVVACKKGLRLWRTKRARVGVSSRDSPKWRGCFLATAVAKVGRGGTCLGVIGGGPVMGIRTQKSNEWTSKAKNLRHNRISLKHNAAMSHVSLVSTAELCSKSVKRFDFQTISPRKHNKSVNDNIQGRIQDFF